MPLTSKGKKIMRAMRKQYGKKEGKKVFYASRNKGTISGVEKNEESKMSYLDKVINIHELDKSAPYAGVFSDLENSMDDSGDNKPSSKKPSSKKPSSRKPMKNKDPLPAGNYDRPEQAAQARRDVKKPRTQQNIDPNDPNLNRASIKSHTEYKRIGIMMAEALGYRVDEAIPLLLKTIAKRAVKAKMAQTATDMATNNNADEEENRRREKEKRRKAEAEANQTQAGQDPAMALAHTEYKRIGALMAEALGLRENVVEPTKKQMVKAQKQTNAMPVEGETSDETRAVDKEIKKAQGKKKMSTATPADFRRAQKAAGQRAVQAGRERDEAST